MLQIVINQKYFNYYYICETRAYIIYCIISIKLANPSFGLILNLTKKEKDYLRKSKM